MADHSRDNRDGAQHGAEVEPDFASRREQLVEILASEGIRDPRVLRAIGEVERHLFVPEPHRFEAYADHALPIGAGQTISQPYVVARMSELLGLSGGDKVLEVGTGSGYQAAVLARLADSVFTVERIREHHEKAKELLERLGLDNVTTRLGDGSIGLSAEAPFDAIIVTAAAPRVPSTLLDQLAPGGRLVMPIGGREHQIIRRITRRVDHFDVDEDTAVRFVPLIGENGW